MEIIIEALIQFIFWIVILPILMVFGTPVILLTCIFKKGSYAENVKMDYKKLFEYWKDRV